MDGEVRGEKRDEERWRNIPVYTTPYTKALSCEGQSKH